MKPARLGHLVKGLIGRSSAPVGSFTPGTIVADRYRIEEVLGEGAMGIVYRARHLHMRTRVALKVLHPSVSSEPEIVARFEREAVAVGNITHPNVAQAKDFGRLPDGSFFLVLEYVEGRTLRSLISDGPLPTERALHITRQLTAAVGAAHARGVVHRDLKPENVMLVHSEGDPDFVKVLDFGIAKVGGLGTTGAPGVTPPPGGAPPAEGGLTRMGTVVGTPDYMSPEQALGQPIDARSDLYSIGVVLYEMLSGKRPFTGGPVSILRKQVIDEVPPLPPAVLRNLDPRVLAVLERLLQKTPADRYANATELLTAIDECMRAEAAVVPTLILGESRDRGSRGIAIAAAAGVCLLVVLGWALVEMRAGAPAVPAPVPSSRVDTVPSDSADTSAKLPPPPPPKPSAAPHPTSSKPPRRPYAPPSNKGLKKRH